MSTFDSSRYDIPTLVEKLHDQRFDGYDPESLAREVEKFREGGGTAGMGDAVDALKQVAGALSHTDTTLRDQLAALGVSWHSEAGGQASTVLADQAGFSADANTKVAQAAQLIFEQGEAFNRTKNKLPDPEALRQGDGGYTMSDTLFSLFGFETDHAASVKANTEAKAQAVDALNAYAHDSGNYLASSQPVEAPQSMNLLSAPGAAAESVAGPTIEPVPPVSSVPDTSPTVAAGAKDAPVRTVPVVAAAPPPAPSAPTPPIGIPAAQHPGAGATAPSQTTTPSSAPPARTPMTEPISGVAGGRPRSGQQETIVRPGPGQAPLAPGQQVGGVGGVPGNVPGDERSAGAWGKPGSPAEGAPRVPVGSGEALLGKGKVFGSVPGGAAGTTNVGPGFANVRAAGGVGALAEGAPAIGAAGVGGATSGERERNRPGRGGDASKRVRQLPVGDLPEEEEALRARKAAPEPPTRERTRAILEPAATQDGEEDAEHVRRFGVDDRDLFADPRAVSPHLIGDKPLPEE
ncbi:hypothetical protein LWP59_39395 [Amycolatopsis acidiphila]|uniref:PPE domain-containing protein n=1 Tax=Amycolatopsis acidiphila TaxID=715473 RepID=A0A558AH12_9PSEU|nr:hypothetical protein [Amycolatopsis acidiphila]TVT23516.1 hypothetical protein FNH06_10025 [Amycolatopsis acidiphila]UIJ59976.1 hypothetical protein LWP59_39395 [Amycolatopsis acidiphila]GHG62106.1 hypothetical protein GCM10017788_17400 [Amycolatopsis acidiphila]